MDGGTAVVFSSVAQAYVSGGAAPTAERERSSSSGHQNSMGMMHEYSLLPRSGNW
jgi:hypothetical protein